MLLNADVSIQNISYNTFVLPNKIDYFYIICDDDYEGRVDVTLKNIGSLRFSINCNCAVYISQLNIRLYPQLPCYVDDSSPSTVDISILIPTFATSHLDGINIPSCFSKENVSFNNLEKYVNRKAVFNTVYYNKENKIHCGYYTCNI